MHTPASAQHLRLLSELYPTREAAATELCRLSAMGRLPRGTEYFFSDLHGEHEAFLHLLRSGAGNIREKLDGLFYTQMTERERGALAELVYYPETILPRIAKNELEPGQYDEWYALTLHRLVLLCREVAHKDPLRELQEAMDPALRSMTEELLLTFGADREGYLSQVIDSIVQTHLAPKMIAELCRLIRHTAVDSLHILGDVYDRGPRPDRIMDELMRYPEVDITWGNHDIVWIGAMAGSRVCLMSLLRIALNYNCFDLLEDGYGLNLRPLSMFAQEVYGDDNCARFLPHRLDENRFDIVDPQLTARMHKAAAILLFKLEGQLIRRHPEYELDHRLLLDKIDLPNGVLHHPMGDVPLADNNFPTVDFTTDPYALTEQEEVLLEGLYGSFRHSASLRRHLDWMVRHGSMYRIVDHLLLYHGCIPINEDGTPMSFEIDGKAYAGKALLDSLDQAVRRCYYHPGQYDSDLFWYLWNGRRSPLFGRDRMTTFERYFTTERALFDEPRNSYYAHFHEETLMRHVLEDFGLNPETARVVNGHVPVKRGEDPVKAGGRLLVIDGGISKSYHSTTGIAGYTLIRNSTRLMLAEHQPFEPSTDTHPARMSTKMRTVELSPHRVTVDETDLGARYHQRIEELRQLLELYENGLTGSIT